MDLYEIIQDMNSINNYRTLSRAFSNDKRKELTKKDKELFDLLKNISSLSFKITDDKVELLPAIQIGTMCIFSIEDLTEHHYVLLKSIDLSKIPLLIKARICDIIWCKKRDFPFSTIAIKTYFELFNLWFQDDDWQEAITIIKRAINISVQTKQDRLYDKCCQAVYDNIIRIDGKDSGFLSITLISLIIKQDYGDIKKIIDILNNIILLNANDPNKTEKAYLLKFKILNKMKKTEEATQSNLALAEYFVKYGEDIVGKSEETAIRAQVYFRKAIKLYRECEKNSVNFLLFDIVKASCDVIYILSQKTFILKCFF